MCCAIPLYRTHVDIGNGEGTTIQKLRLSKRIRNHSSLQGAKDTP